MWVNIVVFVRTYIYIYTRYIFLSDAFYFCDFDALFRVFTFGYCNA